MAKTVTHKDFLALKASKGLPFTPSEGHDKKRKFPTVGYRGAFIIRVGEKPLHKELRKATLKGNNYMERLERANTVLIGEVKTKPIKMVKRQRLNKASSSFAFSLIGSLDTPQRVRRTRQIVIENSEGKKHAVATKHENVRLSIGLHSGKLPAWFR